MMRSETPAYFPLPVLEDRFTSNELDELLSFFQFAGDDADVEEFRGTISSSNSSLDGQSNPVSEEMDEKRRKRKISNRESARKSRLRKKRHVENLTAQLNRLKTQNREYTNRLTMVLNQLHAVKTQNELIRFESVYLIRRHADLNRILQSVRYPQYKNNIFINNNVNSGQFVDGHGLLSS